jgi:cytoskeletal protein CcmA (bactofilin family)
MKTLNQDGSMRTQRMIDNERGIALVVVLLVVLAVAAIIAGAALLGSNTSLIAKHQARLSVLETVADAGIEEARSRINGDKTQYPDSGYNILEAGVAVYNSAGAVIPNVKRWLYAGPSGVTSGQYGVFGSIVSVAQDPQGNRAIRRGEVYQESFSKYAYFTTIEGAIVFANGDQIQGPVHSNDNITINSSGATFFGPVSTAGVINGKTYGTFKAGYKEHVPAIPMPSTADLTKLQAQAALGNTAITGTTSGTAGQATTRIEFVALDLDADGDSTDDDEGFMKVYQVALASNAWFVVADTSLYLGSNTTRDTAGVRNSPNCGHLYSGSGTNHSGRFLTFRDHLKTWTSGNDSKMNAPGALVTSDACYLGGSDILNADATHPNGQFLPTDKYGYGSWLPWPGAVDPRIATALGANAAEAPYLWPINRVINPSFKGVIHVAGKVAVSGKLRGRVTLAATSNIIIADDIRYVTNPGAANCADLLGLFSGNDIVVADNLINDPIPWLSGKAATHWDADSPDEFITGFVLALDIFTVENYDQGSTNAEPCGASTNGRGCLFLTGGIIQKQRGAVGLTSGEGYIKRYAYDACGLESPPPYFPTTGHFARGHYFEVEPTGFNIDSYWALLIPH